MNNVMKKTLIASAFGLLVSANGAMAATSQTVAGGTITFSGSVSDTTCDVTTSGDKDFTVSLSPVATSALENVTGVYTGASTQFDMKVSGCTGYTDESDALSITFSGSNVSDDEAYLKNDTGSASGVGIAITKDGTTAVGLNKAITTALTGAGDGTLTYHANYYVTGSAVEAGTVVTSATYTFNYQ